MIQDNEFENEQLREEIRYLKEELFRKEIYQLKKETDRGYFKTALYALVRE